MNIITYLSTNLFGIIEDNLVLFVYPYLGNPLHDRVIQLLNYPLGQTLTFVNDNQVIFWTLYYSLARGINLVLYYNIWVFTTLLITFFVCLWAFNKFFHDRLLSAALSILFLFSGYLSYQLRSHIDLAQIWLFVVFITLFLFYNSKIKYLILGVLLALITGMSNYIGFMTLVFLSLFIIIKQICSLVMYKISYWTKRLMANYILLFVTYLVAISVFLFPHIKANYIEKTSDVSSVLTLNRPFEDFVTLSSRPWYYVLPSVDNPFFGKITSNVVDWMQDDWKYFLAQNYFKSEHSAAYLGWVNIITALIGLRYLVGQYLKKTMQDYILLDLFSLGLTAILLITITMPPYITISGLKLYMPSMFLWKYFPMFRVLARFGVLILFITLYFSGFGYKAIFEYIKNSTVLKYPFLKRAASKSILLLLFSISIMEFYVPIRITNVSTPPKIVNYLKNEIPANSPIALYPHHKKNTFIYWLPYYNKPLINSLKESDTQKLLTCQGLLDAENAGAKYYIVFNKSISVNTMELINGLENIRMISKIADFSEEQTKYDTGKYYTISGIGTSDSAVVYSLNASPNYKECVLFERIKE